MLGLVHFLEAFFQLEFGLPVGPKPAVSRFTSSAWFLGGAFISKHNLLHRLPRMVASVGGKEEEKSIMEDSDEAEIVHSSPRQKMSSERSDRTEFFDVEDNELSPIKTPHEKKARAAVASVTDESTSAERLRSSDSSTEVTSSAQSQLTHLFPAGAERIEPDSPSSLADSLATSRTNRTINFGNY